MRIFLTSSMLALCTGCCPCQSAREARATDEALRAENVRRAEGPMRAAAARAGAALLPIAPSVIEEPAVCASAIFPERAEGRAEASCVRWSADDEGVHRIFDGQGKPWLAVTVTAPGWQYARLARRDTTLVLLSPKPRVDETRRATQCECDGTPRIGSSTWNVFLLEDSPGGGVTVEHVEVPIEVDRLSWRCERTLL